MSGEGEGKGTGGKSTSRWETRCPRRGPSALPGEEVPPPRGALPAPEQPGKARPGGRERRRGPGLARGPPPGAPPRALGRIGAAGGGFAQPERDGSPAPRARAPGTATPSGRSGTHRLSAHGSPRLTGGSCPGRRRAVALRAATCGPSKPGRRARCAGARVGPLGLDWTLSESPTPASHPRKEPVRLCSWARLVCSTRAPKRKGLLRVNVQELPRRVLLPGGHWSPKYPQAASGALLWVGGWLWLVRCAPWSRSWGCWCRGAS